MLFDDITSAKALRKNLEGATAASLNAWQLRSLHWSLELASRENPLCLALLCV